MNVIDYIAITCNLKKCPITDYIWLHEKCNRLQPITITNYDHPMSEYELNKRYGKFQYMYYKWSKTKRGATVGIKQLTSNLFTKCLLKSLNQ